MVWKPEATHLNLIWRWEFVIPVAGRGGEGISWGAFIALHTLHLVGQFIALHASRRRFISSPEFWRRTAASVGPEAAPHLMELSRPNQTLTVKENLGGVAAKRVFLRRLDEISARTKICSSSCLYHKTEFIEVWVWTWSCCCSLAPVLAAVADEERSCVRYFSGFFF